MSSSAKRKAKKESAPKKSAPRTKKASKTPAKEGKAKAPAKEKKAAEKKEAPQQKPVVRAERVNVGPAPFAVVAARHAESLRERAARGFSFGELASAGVPIQAARREGLSVDVRRRSVLEGNVDLLKGWYKGTRDSSETSEPSGEVAMASIGKKK